MSSENGAGALPKSLVSVKASPRTWRSAKRALKRFSKKVLGWIMIALGFVFLAAGFLLIIIPGHYFLVLIGLILILRNVDDLGSTVIRLLKRYASSLQRQGGNLVCQ